MDFTILESRRVSMKSLRKKPSGEAGSEQFVNGIGQAVSQSSFLRHGRLACEESRLYLRV